MTSFNPFMPLRPSQTVVDAPLGRSAVGFQPAPGGIFQDLGKLMPTMVKLMQAVEEPERQAQALEAKRLASEKDLGGLTAKLNQAEKSGKMPPGYSPFLYRHVNAQLGRRAVNLYKEQMELALSDFNDADSEESPYAVAERVAAEVAAQFPSQNVDFDTEWEAGREDFTNDWRKKAFTSRGASRLKRALEDEEDILRGEIDAHDIEEQRGEWQPDKLGPLISKLSRRMTEFAKNVKDSTGRSIPKGAVKNMVWKVFADKVQKLMDSGDVEDAQEAAAILEGLKGFDLTAGKFDENWEDKDKRSKTSFGYMFATEMGRIEGKAEKSLQVAEMAQGAQGFANRNRNQAGVVAAVFNFVGPEGKYPETVKSQLLQMLEEGKTSLDIRTRILSELAAVTKVDSEVEKLALTDAAKKALAGRIENELQTEYSKRLAQKSSESHRDRISREETAKTISATARGQATTRATSYLAGLRVTHKDDPLLLGVVENEFRMLKKRREVPITELTRNAEAGGFLSNAAKELYAADAFSIIRSKYPEITKYFDAKGITDFGGLKSDPKLADIFERLFKEGPVTKFDRDVVGAITNYEKSPELQKKFSGGELDPLNANVGKHLNAWFTDWRDLERDSMRENGQLLQQAVEELNIYSSQDRQRNPAIHKALQAAAGPLQARDKGELSRVEARIADAGGYGEDVSALAGEHYDQWMMSEHQLQFQATNLLRYMEDPTKAEQQLLEESGIDGNTTDKWHTFSAATFSANAAGRPYDGTKMVEGRMVPMNQEEFVEAFANPSRRGYGEDKAFERPTQAQCDIRTKLYWTMVMTTGGVYKPQAGEAPLDSSDASNPDDLELFTRQMTDYKDTGKGYYTDRLGYRVPWQALDPTKSAGLFHEKLFVSHGEGTPLDAQQDELNVKLAEVRKAYERASALGPSASLKEVKKLAAEFEVWAKDQPVGSLAKNFGDNYLALPRDVKSRVAPHEAYAAQLDRFNSRTEAEAKHLIKKYQGEWFIPHSWMHYEWVQGLTGLKGPEEKAIRRLGMSWNTPFPGRRTKQAKWQQGIADPAAKQKATGTGTAKTPATPPAAAKTPAATPPAAAKTPAATPPATKTKGFTKFPSLKPKQEAE